jgi:integrase
MPRDHKRTQEITSKNSQVLVKALINLNQRLRSARLRVRVENMNEALYLRGVIPGPGDEWRQRRIPLGLKFAGGNLIAAEVKAKDLAGDLAAAAAGMGSFPLAKWGLLLSTPEDSETVGFWVDRLISQVAEGLAPSSIKDYRRALGRLDRSATLSSELLLEAMSDPWLASHPRTQLLCSQKFGQLARLAGLTVDLSRHRGGYSPALVGERLIPDRDQVLEAWHSIDVPGWRWVLGILIVFGVRNHEALQLDIDDLIAGGHSVWIRKGKTGPRTAWASSPADVDLFQLRDRPCSPMTSFGSNDVAGHRVTKYLTKKRLGGWTPYALRHAWAIQSGLGPNALPSLLAAQSQGHSQRIHEGTYQRWVSPEIQRGAYESAHGLRD